MPRNKSEKLRKQRLQAYYEALHGFWPQKVGLSDSPLLEGNYHFRNEVGNTFALLERADRDSLARVSKISKRFEWLDKQLQLTV